MKRIISGLIILAVLMVAIPLGVKAEEGGVTLTVTVIEKKQTDTINDFNFTTLNPSAIKSVQNSVGEVKGVSVERDGYLVKLLNFFRKFF